MPVYDRETGKRYDTLDDYRRDKSGGSSGSSGSSTGGMTDAEIAEMAMDPSVNNTTLAEAMARGEISPQDAARVASEQEAQRDAVLRGERDNNLSANNQQQTGLPAEIRSEVDRIWTNLKSQAYFRNRDPQFSDVQFHLDAARGSKILPAYDSNDLYAYVVAKTGVDSSVTSNAGSNIQDQDKKIVTTDEVESGVGSDQTNTNVNMPNVPPAVPITDSQKQNLQRILGAGADITLNTVADMFPELATEDHQRIFSSLQEFQNDMFGEQPLRYAQFRGVENAFGQPFGNFSPLGQQALNTSFRQFQDINPIMNFFQQQELGDAFGGFLSSPRPTPQGVGDQLTSILSSVRNTPDAMVHPTEPRGTVSDLFQIMFNSPERALAAGTAPFVMSMAPRLRDRAASVLNNQFGSQFASNPAQFSDISGILDLFETFKQRGFF